MSERTPEESARFDRIYGPMKAVQRADIRSDIEKAAGFVLTDDEWSHLTRWCSRARGEFMFEAPPTAASRKRVAALQTAAKAFRDASRAVLDEMELETFPMGRVPASISLSGNIETALEEFEEFRFDAVEGADFLAYALSSAKIIEAACNLALRETAPPLLGNKIAGYDTFLKVCRLVWSRHADGPGYKWGGGQWRGKFVNFVVACQCLIPGDMRRNSSSAVGEAINSWTERGEPFVEGNSSRS